MNKNLFSKVYWNLIDITGLSGDNHSSMISLIYQFWYTMFNIFPVLLSSIFSIFAASLFLSSTKNWDNSKTKELQTAQMLPWFSTKYHDVAWKVGVFSTLLYFLFVMTAINLDKVFGAISSVSGISRFSISF